MYRKNMIVLTAILFLTLIFFGNIIHAQSSAVPPSQIQNQSIKIVLLPDLLIDNIRVATCPAGRTCIVYRGNQPTFNFGVIVKNNGTAVAGNSLLRVKWEAFNAAGRIIDSGFFDAAVPAIDRGRISTHTFTMTTPAAPAVRCRLRPIADYDNDVRESNETNNATRTLSILIRP